MCKIITAIHFIKSIYHNVYNTIIIKNLKLIEILYLLLNQIINMSIRYAEVTIIKNLNKETVTDYFGRLMGKEITVTDDDTIIIQFDDGLLVDTSNYNEDDLYDNSSEFYEDNSNTDVMSYTNTNIESKYDSEVNSYTSEESETRNRIILLPGIYIPQKSLDGFILNRKLFNLNIPNSVSLLFGCKYTISYKNLFNTKKNNNTNNRDSSLKSIKIETSIYNMIYSCMSERDSLLRIDSFGIAKIESSDLKPRFIVAYKDKYFKKYDIVYLVDHIFKYKF